LKRVIELYKQETIDQLKKINGLTINIDNEDLNASLRDQIRELQAESDSLIAQIEMSENKYTSLYNLDEAKCLVQNELAKFKRTLGEHSDISEMRTKLENLKKKSIHLIFGNNLIELNRKQAAISNDFPYYYLLIIIISCK